MSSRSSWQRPNLPQSAIHTTVPSCILHWARRPSCRYDIGQNAPSLDHRILSTPGMICAVLDFCCTHSFRSVHISPPHCTIHCKIASHAIAHTAVRAYLQGLFRSAQHKKQAEFLGRSFNNDKDRAAAAKNAFVLLSQHKPQLAAAFFILGLLPCQIYFRESETPLESICAARGNLYVRCQGNSLEDICLRVPSHLLNIISANCRHLLSLERVSPVNACGSLYLPSHISIVSISLLLAM